MIAMEKMWLDSECGPQPGLKDVIADDFQGTAPDGHRYLKADAVASTSSGARDCRLGEVKIHFFSDSIAVAYGEESSVRKGKDGKDSTRCLAWTDTWLKRGGKWQIVGAQDTLVACK